MLAMSYKSALAEPFLALDQVRSAMRGCQVDADRHVPERPGRSVARQAWSIAARHTGLPAQLEDLAAEWAIGLPKAISRRRRNLVSGGFSQSLSGAC